MCDITLAFIVFYILDIDEAPIEENAVAFPSMATNPQS
jgi:hypothetical protein